MRTSQHEIAAPLGPARGGRLEVAARGSRLTLSCHRTATELYRARFEGVAPMVLTHEGRVTIEYPHRSPSEWLQRDPRAAQIALNQSLPWTLVFAGGISGLSADLRHLTLGELEIRGGASDVDVALPRPRGIVSIRVAGGASGIRLNRPAASVARLHLAGGGSTLAFDDQRFGAIGGDTHLANPGAEKTADRYEIEISGGASALAIWERDEGAGER